MKRILVIFLALLCLVGCSKETLNTKDSYITKEYIVNGKEMSISKYAKSVGKDYSEMVHVLNVKKNTIETDKGVYETTFKGEKGNLTFWDYEDESCPALSGGVYYSNDGGHKYEAKVEKDTLQLEGTDATEVFKEDDGISGRLFASEKEVYEFHNNGKVGHRKNGGLEEGTFTVSDTIEIKYGEKSESFTPKKDDFGVEIVRAEDGLSFSQIKFIK